MDLAIWSRSTESDPWETTYWTSKIRVPPTCFGQKCTYDEIEFQFFLKKIRSWNAESSSEYPKDGEKYRFWTFLGHFWSKNVKYTQNTKDPKNHVFTLLDLKLCRPPYCFRKIMASLERLSGKRFFLKKSGPETRNHHPNTQNKWKMTISEINDHFQLTVTIWVVRGRSSSPLL